MAESALILRHITKWFGRMKAVDDLSLDIKSGQMFTLLGPSGCGKTTTLRMIAGLERPDSGEILLKGQPIVSVSRRLFVPPEKRNMGMVFQSYAIWPNMTVAKNVAYPLELRKVSSSVIKEKVNRVLNLVGLEGLGDRPAPHLSGGQQQRVALARALVYEPEILLLDEPLSNLDAKLREQMRVELKLLQQKLGITVIYVTHDQLEALSLSDQVVVLSRGQIEQQGKPRDLYEQPQTPFVRDFLGKTVVLRGITRTVEGGQLRVELTHAGSVVVECPCHSPNTLAAGQKVYVSVRPEDVVVTDSTNGAGDNHLKGTVETVLFAGERTECQIKVGEESILVYVPRSYAMDPGQSVSFRLPKETVNVWPA